MDLLSICSYYVFILQHISGWGVSTFNKDEVIGNCVKMPSCCVLSFYLDAVLHSHRDRVLSRPVLRLQRCRYLRDVTHRPLVPQHGDVEIMLDTALMSLILSVKTLL